MKKFSVASITGTNILSFQNAIDNGKALSENNHVIVTINRNESNSNPLPLGVFDFNSLKVAIEAYDDIR